MNEELELLGLYLEDEGIVLPEWSLEELWAMLPTSN